MWSLLRQLNEKGLTILLTTHYIEEAQSLCGRVALMNGGRLNEIDTPGQLIISGAINAAIVIREKSRTNSLHFSHKIVIIPIIYSVLKTDVFPPALQTHPPEWYPASMKKLLTR